MLEILGILVDWCLRLLVRCQRFMEQCVPLGKDPNDPRRAALAHHQTRAAQEQTADQEVSLAPGKKSVSRE
jgi:hypothetical protein